MRKISEIAEAAGIPLEYLENYGNYKAKVSLDILQKLEGKSYGKLVFVSAITATPFGEGKTVTSIGLTQALGFIGKKAHLCLREPSLGPVFGVKGGASGTARSCVLPSEDINLHFNGDIHAVGAANNLLAALVDNHIYHGNELGIEPSSITWRRVLDMSDRQLRDVICGLGGKTNGVLRETGFDITAASEIMAILALSNDIEDLKARIGRIMIGFTYQGRPVFVSDLGCAGAVALLLKEAIKPNLVQTYEGQPAFIHAGPFANIAHGNNSVIATRTALKLADYAVTEGGFAVDLGAEKFFDIVHRQHPDLTPSVVVVVASLKALKMHGGMEKDRIKTERSREALGRGMANLRRHVETVRLYGLEPVVAINRFPDDCAEELAFVKALCESDLGTAAEVSEVAARGGEGGEALARAVVAAAGKPSNFRMLYDDGASIKEKIDAIATKIYRAGKIVYSMRSEKEIAFLEKAGFSRLPVNIAKTQLSTTDTPNVCGAPEGFTFNVREIRPALGAGFIVAIAGEMMTLPGLPKAPAAMKMDIDASGYIKGVS